MSQSTSSRRVAICAVVLVISVFAVVGVGTTTADSANNETETPIIEDTGGGRDVYVYENSTTLRDVSVKTGGTGARIFINTKHLENNGVKTGSSNITEYNISGGKVTKINSFKHNNHTVFEIVVGQTSDSNTLDFEHLTISGLDNSRLNSTISSRFYLSVSSTESGIDYTHLLANNQVKLSRSFNIVANSVNVSDQATISTTAFSESPTSPSITVNDIVTNVDSMILITQGYNGTEVAGIAEQPATSTQGRQNISIRLNTIGGEKRVYVIPKHEVEWEDGRPGDTVSHSTLDSATATDSAYVYSGIIDINNQTRNGTVDTDLKVRNVELLDMSGGSTPYVVSLHPITSDRQIVYDTVYGYSNKLVGKSENVSIDLKDHNTVSELYSKNRLAAVLQLHNNTTVDNISSSSISPLSNSEFKHGFVGTGVSDTATIDIDEISNTSNDQAQITDIYGSKSTRSAVYSGTMVVDNDSSMNSSGGLYAIDQSRHILASVGYYGNNNSEIRYETKGLESGNYTITENKSITKRVFRIVGPEDQYVQFGRVESLATNSEAVEFRIKHHTPKSRIHLTKSNTTAATIELATPKRGATTLELNTYLAAAKSLNESVSVRGSNASIASITTPDRNGTLSPGRYELSVHSTQGLAKTSDNASLTLTRRATNRLTAYAGPEAAGSELKTAAAVRDAIESGTLSPAEQIGGRDTVVYAVNASGLTGLVRTQNTTLETGRDLERLGGLEFGVRSDGRNTSQSAGDVLGETPPNATVHADRTGLYVVTDGANAFPTDGAPTPGAEFTAAFRVADDRLQAAADPSSDHRVNETVTFATDKRSGSAGGEPERGDSNAPVDDGSGGTSGGGGGAGGGGGGADGGGSGAGPTAGSTGETQGSTPAGSVGHGRPDDGTAENTPESGGNDGGNASEGEIRFAPLPMTAGWLPLEGGSRGVTASAATGPSGPTDSASPVNGAGSTDGDGADGVTEATSGRSGQTDPGEGASSRPTPTYENAPIRATAEDVPGFGPLHTVAALAVTVLTAVRRMRLR